MSHPRPTRQLLASVTLTALAVVSTTPASASANPDRHGSDLAEVRAATARYHQIDRALSDGYELASPCVPNMGYHYQRGVAASPQDLDPTQPEILVYAPRPDGSLKLVAVEYASWQPAELFGTEFDAPHLGGPPFHTLHAWLWQGNPDGTHAPLNPNVRCP